MLPSNQKIQKKLLLLKERLKKSLEQQAQALQHYSPSSDPVSNLLLCLSKSYEDRAVEPMMNALGLKKFC